MKTYYLVVKSDHYGGWWVARDSKTATEIATARTYSAARILAESLGYTLV